MSENEKIDKAVEIGIRYGQIDGSHHRLWVIDQMLRVLLSDKYDKTIADSNGPVDENGQTEYSWDTGIAP